MSNKKTDIASKKKIANRMKAKILIFTVMTWLARQTNMFLKKN